MNHYVPPSVEVPPAGLYHCRQENEFGGRISINLAGLVWEDELFGQKKNYPGFCDLLNVWGGSDPDKFLRFGESWGGSSIFFGDGCTTPANCPIGIVTGSYSGSSGQDYLELHPFHDLTDLPDVGGLGVIGINRQHVR